MFMRATTSRFVIAAAAVLAPLSLTACGSSGSTASSGGGNYQIGFSDGLTGADAAYTGPELKWAKAVFGAVNAAGGVNGHKISLTALDQGNPGSGQATANVTQLVTQDHVSAILGMLISNDCGAVAPVAERYQTPLICQRAALSDLKPVNKDVFIDTDVETMEVEPQISFVKKLLNKPHPRVAVFNSDTIGSDLWAGKWKAQGPKNGIGVSTSQKYELTATNVNANIAAIVASHPDAVVAEIFDQFYQPLVQGLHAAGLNIPVITTSGAVFGSTMQSLAQPGIYETTPSVPLTVGGSSGTAEQKALQAQLASLGTKSAEQVNDGEGSMYAIGPYAVVAALKECGYPCDGAHLADALEKVSTNAGGLVPTSFAYSPSAHVGVKNFVFVHWDPSKQALAVAGTEPAGNPFTAN